MTMSSEYSGLEALDQYRSVSKKLKKTFFKKPNEIEALESYTDLARECENLDLPVYAGLCWNAAAKCENGLGNSTGEITNFVRSARQYAVAEENNKHTGYISLGLDFQASLNSFSTAALKYERGSALAATLNIEIMNFLQKIGKQDSAEDYLKETLENCSEGEFVKIHCLRLLASNFIALGDYLAALHTFIEICHLIEAFPENEANADLLLESEISRVFLLLILKSPPQKLTPEMTKILERYTWGDRNDETLKICKMSDYMFILLESLVTTCQSADTSSLIDLETKLWPVLTTENRDLLHVLLQIYYP